MYELQFRTYGDWHSLEGANEDLANTKSLAVWKHSAKELQSTIINPFMEIRLIKIIEVK